MKAVERMDASGRRIRGWLPKEPVVASRERSAHPRPAVSALALAVVAFVAIGIAVELVFLPSASSPSGVQSTVTTESTVYSCTSPCSPPPLKNAVDTWVQDFNSRDVPGLSTFYATDAAVTWNGAPGLTGTYDGIGNVRILYGSSIGKTTLLIANLTNYNEMQISPGNSNVSLTLTMNGHSTVVGNLSISVDANQQWNYVGGHWQIVKETWNYVKFYESTPVSATTFPQWTALKEGQNPNLVSDKSFEWHAGPYVAASVYAFLVGVLAFGALKFRSRSRRV
jgi:hypothetical protein